MCQLDLEIRRVEKRDMPDVIELLQSMSEFAPSEDDLEAILEEFDSQPNVHSIVALSGDVVVGYGSVVVETKIRGGRMGHIEDIVSHADYRNKGIGKAIVEALFEIAKRNGCYKVALQCKEHNVSFYNKCDYDVSGLAMQRFV